MTAGRTTLSTSTSVIRSHYIEVSKTSGMKSKLPPLVICGSCFGTFVVIDLWPLALELFNMPMYFHVFFIMLWNIYNYVTRSFGYAGVTLSVSSVWHLLVHIVMLCLVSMFITSLFLIDIDQCTAKKELWYSR